MKLCAIAGQAMKATHKTAAVYDGHYEIFGDASILKAGIIRTMLIFIACIRNTLFV